MRKHHFALLSIALLVPVGAQAGVLWQQVPSDGTTGYVNQQFSDDPTFSTYAVNDITVGASGWQITSISEQFTTGGSWPDSFSVVLNIFSKSGTSPQPSDDPTTGSSYSANLVHGATDVVTISGLNILLAPGDYWIGFTPDLAFGTNGQQFQLIASQLGDFTALSNPGNGFGNGTGWNTSAVFTAASDFAIKIDGNLQGASAPEPGSVAMLASGIAALLVARRRRALR